jgi:hypothetical protein
VREVYSLKVLLRYLVCGTAWGFAQGIGVDYFRVCTPLDCTPHITNY